MNILLIVTYFLDANFVVVDECGNHCGHVELAVGVDFRVRTESLTHNLFKKEAFDNV